MEHTELFVRKSGGERISQLYQFNHRGRSLALRPEHTASVVRLFVERMQTEPLPIRLSYCGPVFRYESPQAGRSRQFTEFGCELIGAPGPLADAELIDLAIECTRQAGVSRPYVVIGHIGTVIEYLDTLNLDHRTQDWLLWSMERIRRGEPGASDIPDYLLSPDSGDGRSSFATMKDEDILELLAKIGADMPVGGRTPDEIATGLAERRRRTVDRSVLESALALVHDLIEAAGPPYQAIRTLRRIAETYGLDHTPIEQLAWISETLLELWRDEIEIKIDFGLGRGLRYYTGMIFEIYPDAAERLQLVGGGRYDDLATHLGSRKPFPACGFSLGMERLLSSGSVVARPSPPSVLIVGNRMGGMLWAASEFRDHGWQTELEVRDRSESAARRWATRRGFDALCIMREDHLELTRLSDLSITTHTDPPAAEGGCW